MPAAPLISQLPLVEALATASTTTKPRIAGKNSRFLGPIDLEIERAAQVGGGAVWGANFNGRSNALFAALRGDGVATTYDTQIPYTAFGNYNYLVKLDKSTRTGTATIAANSATVTGSGTQFVTELEIGDEITINGERKIVKAIASATSLTVTEAFQTSGGTLAVFLNDAIMLITTDVTFSDPGTGFTRVTFAAAAKAPLGANIEVHKVTPVSLDSFVTATVQSRRRPAYGKDVLWYVSDATGSPSATSIYAVPVGM